MRRFFPVEKQKMAVPSLNELYLSLLPPSFLSLSVYPPPTTFSLYLYISFHVCYVVSVISLVHSLKLSFSLLLPSFLSLLFPPLSLSHTFTPPFSFCTLPSVFISTFSFMCALQCYITRSFSKAFFFLLSYTPFPLALYLYYSLSLSVHCHAFLFSFLSLLFSLFLHHLLRISYLYLEIKQLLLSKICHLLLRKGIFFNGSSTLMILCQANLNIYTIFLYDWFSLEYFTAEFLCRNI